MSKLNTHVTVHTDDGAITYGPGDKLPAEHEKLITNPKVWAEAPEARSEEKPKGPAKSKAPAKTPTKAAPAPAPAPAADADADAPAGDDGDANDVPIPKKGSTAKAWAEYALSKGFEVDADAKAADIRESLEAEGIPVDAE